MANITDYGSITNQTADISEDQIRAIIERIDLTIHNLLDPSDPFRAADRRDFGAGGFEIEPSRLLDSLLKQRQYWEKKLQEKPEEEWTIFDDAAL